MSIFEDKTIKPNRSAIWIFAPLAAIAVGIILLYNFASGRDFSWTLAFIVFSIFVGLMIIWKVINYLKSNNSEVREYEKQMRKIGRR